MTRDDVIRMARECDFESGISASGNEYFICVESDIERFADLVAAHEREECAKLCDWNEPGHFNELAAAIRSRR